MRTSWERIRLGGMILGVVILIATLGYTYFRDGDILEAIYMVVITISSVGYGERSDTTPGEQFFTILVIIFGISAAGYTVGGLVQMLVDGEIERLLGNRRMTNEIESLKNHLIVCGFGRMGQILTAQLRREKVPFVIVEIDPDRVAEAREDDYLVLQGDATEDDVLIEAGVQRARSLVTGLPNDAANVFITLTARNLNAKLQIIARAEFKTSEKKLQQAGADRVVMPAVIGGERMARLVTRPTTAAMMEVVTGDGELNVELDEFYIPEASKLVGSRVRQLAGERHGLLFVAIKSASGEMHFNPNGDYRFRAHDTVIAMGRTDDVMSFRQAYGLETKY